MPERGQDDEVLAGQFDDGGASLVVASQAALPWLFLDVTAVVQSDHLAENGQRRGVAIDLSAGVETDLVALAGRSASGDDLGLREYDDRAGRLLAVRFVNQDGVVGRQAAADVLTLAHRDDGGRLGLQGTGHGGLRSGGRDGQGVSERPEPLAQFVGGAPGGGAGVGDDDAARPVRGDV